MSATVGFGPTFPGIVATPSLPLQSSGDSPSPRHGDGFIAETQDARDDLSAAKEARPRGIRDAYVAVYGDRVTTGGRANGNSYELLGHDDVAEILDHLAGREDLTETEETIIFDYLVDDVTVNSLPPARDNLRAPGA